MSQLTKEAGGLAAFISRGDDFERQARAFRRKLMRPAVSNLQMNATGVELYDTEPRERPNLFHGSPVRIFGRYRGGGSAAVTVSGDVRGKAFSMTQQLAFPRNDAGNSEIERMWAWHRVQRLLQQDNSSLRDEIVRLGELYSIVTPHTSFLVLENNAEYQRWQIDRRNALQIDRDRARQKELDDQLAKLRAQAFVSNAPQQQKYKSTPTKPKQKFKPHTGATPEPSTIILTLMGAGGLLLRRRRQPQ